MNAEKWIREVATDKELLDRVAVSDTALRQIVNSEIQRRKSEAERKQIEDSERQKAIQHQEALAEIKRANNLAEMRQKREAEHTLWRFWCLADWSERIGILGVFFSLILFGFLLAQSPFAKRVIDFIISIKP